MLSVRIRGLSGGAFRMEATSGGEVLAPRKGQGPDTAAVLRPPGRIKGQTVLPIALRSTTVPSGPAKAPNGPVFQLVDATLVRLSGAQ